MPDDKERLTFAKGWTGAVPHSRELGIEVLEIGDSAATFKLPYDLRLVGNPDTGVIHGGAITTLLDGCSGASVIAALPDWSPIATLDLRIDYLRAADPGRDVFARAHCYKLTKNVAFTRAFAYHDTEADPIASAAATFMLHTRPTLAKGTP